MNASSAGKLAYDPQQLEPMLIARQHAGDVDGMVALFEVDAVIDCGGGRFMRGREAIRDYYAEIVASAGSSPSANSGRRAFAATWRSPPPGFPTATLPETLPGDRPTAPGFG